MAYSRVDPVAVHELFRAVAARFMPVLANRILNNASERCNVDNGTLRASLHVVPGGESFRVGSSLPYARAVHEGSRPHRIVASRARVLRFNGAGGVVFRRSVNHPGYRGNAFLADAMREEVGRL